MRPGAMPMPVSATSIRTPPGRSARRCTETSPVSGVNFTSVRDQVGEDLAEAAALSPRHRPSTVPGPDLQREGRGPSQRPAAAKARVCACGRLACRSNSPMLQCPVARRRCVRCRADRPTVRAGREPLLPDHLQALPSGCGSSVLEVHRLGHAQHAVQGRADLVAHPGQEVALRPIGGSSAAQPGLLLAPATARRASVTSSYAPRHMLHGAPFASDGGAVVYADGARPSRRPSVIGGLERCGMAPSASMAVHRLCEGGSGSPHQSRRTPPKRAKRLRASTLASTICYSSSNSRRPGRGRAPAARRPASSGHAPPPAGCAYSGGRR